MGIFETQLFKNVNAMPFIPQGRIKLIQPSVLREQQDSRNATDTSF